jgi:hypothetical protein
MALGLIGPLAHNLFHKKCEEMHDSVERAQPAMLPYFWAGEVS